MEKQKVIGVIRKRCKGCEICVAFCPKHLFTVDELGKAIYENNGQCIGCGICSQRCPDYAIELEQA